MRELKVALLGNPNCGKSTLFNALTGSHQQIGNWPGVTVERKSGFFSVNDLRIELIDLPGTYSLTAVAKEQAIDTQIACEYLLHNRPDIIVNVVDAAHLDRHLYLSLQLLELKLPLVIALNMMDVADKQGIEIDLALLSEQLGCPVIPVESRSKQGIEQLKHALLQGPPPISPLELYPDALKQAIARLASKLDSTAAAIQATQLAARALESDYLTCQLLDTEQLTQAQAEQKQLTVELDEDLDIVFADLRYSFIQQLLPKVRRQPAKGIHTYTAWLDSVVLNRWLAMPIFLSLMYALFFFAINVGGALQDCFDIASDALFVQGSSYVLHGWHFPPWLIAIISGGAGKGINTTLTFIPVLAAMFLFLSLLEASGYMARAAFVMDRLMRALGLPGKSFVPMIIGFGCNVPAIMATRTLENKRDRILTILMIPFMSCSARMAIFAIFTAAFFPSQGHNIVFCLYLTGIAMAVLTGFILRKCLQIEKMEPLILELPAYHLPSLRTVLRQTWQRLKGFVFRAGKLIVPFCMVLGTVNVINTDGTLSLIEGNPHSILAAFGQWLTPIFNPMGIQAENWPATVGILTGILAKEVVIASLNTLYLPVDNLANGLPIHFELWPSLKAALLTVPANFSALIQDMVHPFTAIMQPDSVQPGFYGQMYRGFGSHSSAFAYLLFVLLYLPCISTVAVIARELNRNWAIFAVFWSTLLAYSVAVIFFQLAHFQLHPIRALLWVGFLLSLLALSVVGLRYQSELNRFISR